MRKSPTAREYWMQMEDRIHLRLANRVEMHQVSVIGQKVVVGAASPFAAAASVDGHVEIERIAEKHRIHHQDG